MSGQIQIDQAYSERTLEPKPPTTRKETASLLHCKKNTKIVMFKVHQSIQCLIFMAPEFLLHLSPIHYKYHCPWVHYLRTSLVEISATMYEVSHVIDADWLIWRFCATANFDVLYAKLRNGSVWQNTTERQGKRSIDLVRMVHPPWKNNSFTGKIFYVLTK
jgi:hypothetical protein